MLYDAQHDDSAFRRTPASRPRPARPGHRHDAGSAFMTKRHDVFARTSARLSPPASHDMIWRRVYASFADRVEAPAARLQPLYKRSPRKWDAFTYSRRRGMPAAFYGRCAQLIARPARARYDIYTRFLLSRRHSIILRDTPALYFIACDATLDFPR